MAGRWLQGLSLGWHYHDGMIYFFSGERKGWEDAENACRILHSHLTSITSPKEQVGAGTTNPEGATLHVAIPKHPPVPVPQDYLAREARGASYWIGLVASGPEGSWHWVDGTAYSPSKR